MGIFQDVIDIAENDYKTQDSKTDIPQDVKEFTQGTIDVNESENAAQEDREDIVNLHEQEKDKDESQYLPKQEHGRKESEKADLKKEKSLKDIFKEVAKTKEPQEFTDKSGEKFTIMPNKKGGLDIYSDKNLKEPTFSSDDSIFKNKNELTNTALNGFQKMFENKLFGMAGLETPEQENEIRPNEVNKNNKDGKEQNNLLDNLKELVDKMSDKELNKLLQDVLNTPEKNDFIK